MSTDEITGGVVNQLLNVARERDKTLAEVEKLKRDRDLCEKHSRRDTADILQIAAQHIEALVEVERLRGVVAAGLHAVKVMDDTAIDQGLLEPGTESADAAMIRAALTEAPG